MAAGNIPAVTVPALPTGATGVKLYVTPPGGASGTEVFYAASNTAGVLNLNLAVNPASMPPPAASTLPLPPSLPLNSIIGGLGGISVVRILPTQFSVGNTLDTQVLVAATTAGVMLSQDGGRTWTNESLRGGVVVNGGASFSAAGLPYGLPASNIILVRSIVPNDQAVLYAAIPGQGVFRATLASFAFLGNVSNLQLPLQWTATNNSGPTNSLNVMPI